MAERLGSINRITESVGGIIDFGRPMAQKILELSKTPKVRGVALGLSCSVAVAIMTILSPEKFNIRLSNFLGATGIMGLGLTTARTIIWYKKVNQVGSLPQERIQIDRLNSEEIERNNILPGMS